MTGCSALNCKLRPKNGMKMYIIPTRESNPRRAGWFINSRKKQTPIRLSYICEKYFEESPFAMVSGTKKLKKSYPSFYDGPSPPPKINESPRKSGFIVLF